MMFCCEAPEMVCGLHNIVASHRQEEDFHVGAKCSLSVTILVTFLSVPKHTSEKRVIFGLFSMHGA